MNQGRPGKATQITIQEKLREYFEYGVTATLASEKTGINIKTVCKYFEEWYEAQVEQQNSDYFERQKVERGRIIVSLDRQIVDAMESIEDIDAEIQQYKKDNKTIPRHLFVQRLDIQRFIVSVIEKKGSFALQPLIDEALRQKISEMLKEHAARQSS